MDKLLQQKEEEKLFAAFKSLGFHNLRGEVKVIKLDAAIPKLCNKLL